MRGQQSEANVLISAEGLQRTLAVKRVRYQDGSVLTFDDITDQLTDQRRAAWSDIARRIAHEIKNPLTPIQLAAERLQRRFGEEVSSDKDTFGRLTGTIIRQVGDLRRMVDEFSNFARMPKPVFRDENVHEIARQALFLHEVAHPAISFTLDPPTGDFRMVCDRRQLSQALTNVVKNAVEAIESRRNRGEHSLAGDRVDLKLHGQDALLIIDVLDTGVGLPEDRERLTEPYMTTRVRGTGLGLAIVKKIVEEHMGEIAFLDRRGGGTHVRISFDTAKLAGMSSDETKADSQEQNDDVEDSLMALEVLVVDDEADIRELVSGVLEDEGYAVRTAGDSDSTLEAIEERRPSMVLLDVWLQGSKFDGLQLLQEIKRRDSTIPVLMISGHGNLDTAVAAVREGAVDFIEKPFEAERLIYLVDRATDTDRLRRENETLRRQVGHEDQLHGSSVAINTVRATLEACRADREQGVDLGPARSGQGDRCANDPPVESARARSLHRPLGRDDEPRARRRGIVRQRGRGDDAPRPS